MLIRISRTVFGLLPLVALGRQFMIHLSLGYNVTNYFSYYTNLSNAFTGCTLLLSGMASSTLLSVRSRETLRVIAVINMSLVGIVFAVLLRAGDLGSLLPWVNMVLHYLMPCLVLIDWIVIPPQVALGRRELIISLAFPLAYVVYSLARGQIVGWFPYPFLNSNVVGGAGGVASYVVGITLAFGLVGWALIALGNRRRRSHPSR